MDRMRSRQFTVLVGDDDAAVLASVVELVRVEGLTVRPARSGSEALHVLLSMPIDFTILDVHMPDMTGFEVMERYLAGPLIAPAAGAPERLAAPRLPAIFMSGEATTEMHAHCRESGWRLLDKPFDPSDMRAAVNRVLEHLNF
jgi:CheY-like chemotaxis protein